MAFTNINGINLYYEQHGTGEDLILISGYGADHTSWLEVLEPLSEKYRVTVFDNRGAGKTDAPAELYSLSQMAADVAALMSVLGVTKAHFLGHSMGVKVAVQLAIQYPHLVNKLLLVSGKVSIIGFPLTTLSTINKRLQAYQLPAELLIETFDPWLYAGEFLADKERYQKESKRMRQQMACFSENGKIGQIAAANIDLLEKCALIKSSTLVIHGDEDVLILPKFGMAIAQAIPNAQYQLIKSCGHMPQFEKPLELVELINNFVSQ